MSHEKNANVKIKIKWITVSGSKAEHFAPCIHCAEGQLAACSLPPTPIHCSRLSPQHLRCWVMDWRRGISPHKYFPRGKSVKLLVSQNSVPSPWKWKITIGFCVFSKFTSQKRPSAQFQLCSANSQVCDEREPNPSPLVSNQVDFSNSSFTY